MKLRCLVATAAVLTAAGSGGTLGPATTARAEAPAPASVRPAPDRPARSAIEPSPPRLFDPARHMHVSEVKIGMKGYGLSVFKGTKIERFDVEVVSILRNFNPKCDVVLITCQGQNLQHTGSVAGMSGSPVFLRDDQGRERMIGAFAYGWPLAKDPIAGVQPIEYMLNLSTEDAPPPGTGAPGATALRHDAAQSAGASWSLPEAMAAWGRSRRGAASAAPVFSRVARSRLGDEGAPRLQPFLTPLMTTGVSPALLEQFGSALRENGLTAVQAGGAAGFDAPASSGVGPGDEPAAAIEPGSVLAVPLLTGDVEVTAIGTCTEVLGDRVFGFGHSFNNEGPLSLPLGSGRISGVVATLTTSFKLGSMTQPRGHLTVDQTVGVAGRLGAAAPMVPIEMTVVDAKGQSREYRFRAAQHPRFTPLVAAMAFSSAVGGASELPQYNTVEYDLTMDFANGRSVRIADTAVNSTSGDLFSTAGLVLQSAAENPFERVPLKKVTGTVHVTSEAREGQILEVNVPRSKYKPGEIVKGFVTYKPFRAAEDTLAVSLELPKDLAAGTYELVISDADRFMADEMATQPFRFTAERVDEMFDAVRDLTAVRHDALYLRLLRPADGVAIGRTAMPQLPGSRRQILMSAGRSNTTAFVSSTVKTIPTDRVMRGSAEFAITIETNASTRAEPAPRPGAVPPAAAPAKAEEARPSRTGNVESPPKAPVGPAAP